MDMDVMGLTRLNALDPREIPRRNAMVSHLAQLDKPICVTLIRGRCSNLPSPATAEESRFLSARSSNGPIWSRKIFKLEFISP